MRKKNMIHEFSIPMDFLLATLHNLNEQLERVGLAGRVGRGGGETSAR